MKKIIISLALVLTIINCKLSIVKSVNFPDKITNVECSKIYYIAGTDIADTRKSGYIDGKKRGVFCSTFYKHGVNASAKLKQKDQWAKPVQAGVAVIIKDYWEKTYQLQKENPNNNRYSNQNRHFNTTYAINIFLANTIEGHKKQRPTNREVLDSMANTVLSNALKKYNEVSHEIDVKLDSKNLRYDTSKVSSGGYYYSNYITASGNYYDKLSVTAEANIVSEEGKSLSKKTCNDYKYCSVVKTDGNGNNKYRLRIKKDWVDENCKNGCKVQANMTFQGSRTYYIAAVYDGKDKQDLVPDYLLKNTDKGKKETAKGEIIISKQTKPKTCNEKLNEILNETDETTYQEKLIQLYEEYDKKYDQIFNLTNPTCSSSKPNNNANCGGATLYANKVENLPITTKNNKTYGYCTATYNLNSQLFNTSEVSKGNLIYKSDNGIVATASINYSCRAIMDAQNTNNYTISIDKLVPDLQLNVLSNKINFTKKVSINGDCSLTNGNKTISCNIDNSIKLSDIKVSDYQFEFEAQVVYTYSDNYKYSFNKENNNLIKTSDCKENGRCMFPSYGVKIDKDNKNIESIISLDLDNTFYASDIDSLSTSCPLTIEENNIKEDMLYRPIETEKPFLNQVGQNRYTGSNWCEDPIQKIEQSVEDKYVEPDNTLKNPSQSNKSCYYKGDLNENGTWDRDDYNILRSYFNNTYTLTDQQKKLADINHDKQVTKDDLINLDAHIDNRTNILGGIYYYTLKEGSGDINLDGILSLDDAILVQKSITGIYKPQEFQIKQADVDGNCELSIADAISIQKKIEGINSFNPDLDTGVNLEDVSDNGSKIEQDEYNNESYSLKDNVGSKNTLSPCASDNNTVLTYIKSRANSNGVIENTNVKVEPLYSFVLTPNDIKEIRSYNKSHGYDDFNLTCTNGKECISSFVTKFLENGLCKKDRTIFCKR